MTYEEKENLSRRFDVCVNRLTLADVGSAVEIIGRIGPNDPESGHEMADRLFVVVLMYIADGGENARGYAKEALKADALNFPRWCA
jgi:hypothetical protein